MRTRIGWAFRWFGDRIVASFNIEHGLDVPANWDETMAAVWAEEDERERASILDTSYPNT